ncbi:hypothetical protein ACP275_11G087000 [Erythranthe tilingii]
MAANAYKTQYGTLDKTIAELLIAGFSSQLKGWWDYYLTNQEQIRILDSIKTDEEGNVILDEEDNPQQEVVATLILTISLHFIGDPSHLKDRNAELLSNLRCRKLSDFQNYKNTFLSRVMLREDSNQRFWKEKFLAGLPTLLGEKVRNKIRETSGKQIIQYNEFTYGQLVSITQQEGLKICQDLKLQQNLKSELKRSKQELGTFCQQFDIGINKPSKDCNGECVRTRTYRKTYKTNNSYKKYNRGNFNRNPRKSNEEYYKSRGKRPQQRYKKPLSKIECYKCHKMGHTANYCKLNKMISEIGLSEDILNKLSAILIDSSDTHENPNTENFSLDENRACQVDEKIHSKLTRSHYLILVRI